MEETFFFFTKRLPLFFRPLIQNKLEVLGKAGLSEDVLEADCTFFKVRVLMLFSENSFVNVSGMALSLCGDVLRRSYSRSSLVVSTQKQETRMTS